MKNLGPLSIGDEIIGINGNAYISKIESLGVVKTTVYNLSLGKHHNYIVEGYVAHNAPPVCGY